MTPAQQSLEAAEICRLAPVVPVLVIDDLAHAAPLAQALVAGGLPALEVTLRTPCALDAIRAMAEVPGGVVGAGTLLTPADVKAAKAAGAKFGVSPGATDRIIAACEDEGLPLLPGAATASEIMLLLEKGFTVQKFFPAEQAGGAAYLKSIGQYYYARNWPRARYYHFTRRYDQMALVLMKLMLVKPFQTIRHLLATGPARLRHEAKMEGKP